MINEESFRLGDNNYFKEITSKHQILLTDTHCGGMVHYEHWGKKNPKGYKKTTPYTVGIDGTTYQHFDSDYWSSIFGLDEIDKGIIPISLENEGSLKFNKKKKKFINWSGDIYRRDKDDVHIEKWRGDIFWSPYTIEQIQGLISLILFLSEKHGIPLRVKDIDYDDIFIENYVGIVTKHDYNILSRDINPSFDRIAFKKQIQKYDEKTY